MTRFRFTAMGAAAGPGSGAVSAAAIVRGLRDADSEASLRTALKSEGLIPVEVSPVSAADAVKAAFAGLSGRSAFGAGGSAARATRADSAWFFQTLSMLLSHHVPVESALGTMDELAPTPRLHASCARVRDALRSGGALADAVAATPGLARPHHIALLKSAQESGRLDHAAALIDRSISSAARLRRTVLTGLFYPAVLAVVSMIVLWLLATFVIPRFADTLQSLGGALPWQTTFTMSAASVLVWLVPALLIVALGAWQARSVWLTPSLVRAGHQWLLRRPITGPLLWNSQGALVCETMATMLEGGSDALSALTQARDVATSPVIVERLDRARAAAREGTDLGQAFKDNNVLPPTPQAVLRIALRAGDLKAGLRDAAALCATDQERLTQRLLALMGPVMILFMAAVVGWVVFSLITGMMALNELGAAL